MRWLLAIVLLMTASASASQEPMDAGADLTASGQCDSRTLFNDCSAQCGMSVCIVGNATCSATNQWMCDCSRVTPCGADMRKSD